MTTSFSILLGVLIWVTMERLLIFSFIFKSWKSIPKYLRFGIKAFAVLSPFLMIPASINGDYFSEQTVANKALDIVGSEIDITKVKYFDQWFVYNGQLEQLKGRVKTIKQSTFLAKGHFDQINQGKQMDKGNFEISFSKDGAFETLRDFDSKNRLILEIIHADSVGKAGKNPKEVLLMKWVKDSLQNSITSELYQKDGTKYNDFVMSFDRLGNISEYEWFKKCSKCQDGLLNELYKFSYSNGKTTLVKTEGIKKQRRIGESIFELNEFGFPSEGESQSKTITFEYKNDDKGNWIEKIIYENNKPNLLVKREIIYYSIESQADPFYPVSWKINKYSYPKPLYKDGRLVVYTDNPFEHEELGRRKDGTKFINIYKKSENTTLKDRLLDKANKSKNSFLDESEGSKGKKNPLIKDYSNNSLLKQSEQSKNPLIKNNNGKSLLDQSNQRKNRKKNQKDN